MPAGADLSIGLDLIDVLLDFLGAHLPFHGLTHLSRGGRGKGQEGR